MGSKKVDLVVLQKLAEVSSRLNQGQCLEDTLQAVADGVVQALGFGGATLNYVLPDGDLEVLAVAGPPEAKELLLGQRTPRAAVDQQLASAKKLGSLYFVRGDDPGPAGIVRWVPEFAPPDEHDAWTPEDGLLIPLRGSGGDFVGLLSVDLPPGLRFPSALLRELLEVFATQAGVAIDQARLLWELRSEHSRLLASEAAFRFAFTCSACPMAMLSLAPERPGVVLRINDALCDALGYDQSELTGKSWTKVVEPDDRPPIEAKLAALVRGDRISQRNEQELVRKDGTKIWTRTTHTVIAAEEAGQEPFLVTQVEDITDERAKEASLRQLASLDPLTGLANRRRLLEELSAFLADPGSSTCGYLIYADIDLLKQVNDRHGHGTGDIVLKEAASRLTKAVRQQDLVARVGGDEFIVFAADLDALDGWALKERIRNAFSDPFPTVTGTVAVSLGATNVIPDTETTPESIIHEADMAMYADKHTKGH